MSALSRVYVLYTGGTIGMAPRQPGVPGSPLVPQPLSELLKVVPELSQLGVELSYGSFEPPLDSSDVGPAQWKQIARAIEVEYNNHDGFVILHGTDTLAYTASALAFMFDNLAKPVVMTGSQLPISYAGTDARRNLINAIKLAGYSASKLCCIPEVVVVFGDRVLRGCRTRKLSSKDPDGFDSPNYQPLGRIGEFITLEEFIPKFPGKGLNLKVEYFLSEDVIDVTIFPGMRPSQLEKFLLAGKGILLRTFGSGNFPSGREFLKVIENAIREKRVILSVSQCNHGGVEMGRYGSSHALANLGVISGSDMTPEAGLTKLMWTLGSKPEGEWARILSSNQRGEQSE